MRSSSKTIVGVLGEVLEVDFDRIVWDKSARVKVKIDITKSFCRVQMIKTNRGEAVMINVKYERLPTICYVWNSGHIERDCVKTQEEEKQVERQ